VRLLAGALLAGLAALSLQPLPSLAERAREPLELRWRTALTGSGRTPTAAPVVSQGRVFLATSLLAAYDRDTGRQLWSRPVARFIPKGLVADSGHVYVAEDSIYSLDAATGETAWVFKPAANTSLGVPALDQGVLYAGTAEHGLVAIAASTGKELWTVDVDPGVASPTVVRGVARYGSVVYVAAEKWLTANGTTASGLLAAFAAADGKRLWKTETPPGGRRGFSTPPLLVGRHLLVGDALGNSLTALDKDSGTVLWSFAGAPGYVGFGTAPLTLGGATVLAASGDGNVYALSLASGAPLWRATTGGSNTAQALCGDLLVVSYQRLAVLAARTGAMLNRDVLGSSHEIVSSGIVSQGDDVLMSGPTALYSFRCNSSHGH
jgi:outer membrane protein assembly factor BamB